jgi:hypothetical protein
VIHGGARMPGRKQSSPARVVTNRGSPFTAGATVSAGMVKMPVPSANEV